VTPVELPVGQPVTISGPLATRDSGIHYITLDGFAVTAKGRNGQPGQVNTIDLVPGQNHNTGLGFALEDLMDSQGHVTLQGVLSLANRDDAIGNTYQQPVFDFGTQAEAALGGPDAKAYQDYLRQDYV
jgi:hypothetical protein